MLKTRTIRAMGAVFAVALASMAFAAVSSATSPGLILVAGVAKTLTALGKTTEGTGEALAGTVPAGTLLVPGLGITINCTGGTGSGKAWEAGSVVKAAATFKFTGCAEASGQCTVKTLGGVSGVIEGSGKGEVIAHAGFQYLKASAQVFATVLLTGAKCLLLEEAEIEGSLAVKLPEITKHLATHNACDLSEVEEALLGVGLTYGNEPAQIELATGKTCDITAKLTGSNAGAAWSVD